MQIFTQKLKQRDELISFTKDFSCKPEYLNPTLTELGTSTLKQRTKLFGIITRPQVGINHLRNIIPQLEQVLSSFDRTEEVIDAAEILIKYSGYIDREKLLAEKMKRLENIDINNKFNYSEILSLSTEARQKLTKIQPRTLGQAARISGVSPSDISVLLIRLGR
jgi:tRNA uridine 5-carboxymethylaminomethyl modification enzyme